MVKPTSAKGGSRTWTLNNANVTNGLAIQMAQYPIMEGIISHLRPKHLIPLAQTCQAVYNHLKLCDSNSLANVRTKTLCSGIGVKIRSDLHHRCHARKFQSWLRCGGDDSEISEHHKKFVESRPCVQCGVNTCDECRIHLTYTYLFEDPTVDNRRWWAGHVLLEHHVTSFLPPEDSDDSKWHLPREEMTSLHDQGRMHVPFSVAATADPESIQRMLDHDLGRSRIQPRGRVIHPFDGLHLTSAFRNVGASRLDLVCKRCVARIKTTQTCHCTLRSRYLDRWICLPCYLEEQDEEAESCKRPVHHGEDGSLVEAQCSCGAWVDKDSYTVVCRWCNLIPDLEDSDIEDHEDEDADNPDDHVNIEDIEMENPMVPYLDGLRTLVPDPQDHEPGCSVPVLWTQEDGTLGLLLGHTIIPTECIGRMFFEKWSKANKLLEEAEWEDIDDEDGCGVEIEIEDMD